MGTKAKTKGLLSRFRPLNREFVTQYNKWENTINSLYVKELNGIADNNYLECQEYEKFIHRRYLDFIHLFGYDKSKYLKYSIDGDFQFYGYIGPFKIYWKYFEEADL